jgi:hypothetical protein
MQSKAGTVKDYLASLPDDRRKVIEAVRTAILKSKDRALEEGMQYGMIGYYVPHSVFEHGYHCDPKQPLPYAGLASQKQHMSLYLMSVYGDNGTRDWFTAAWKKTGKKLDMGKACIRFKSLDDIALDVVAEAFRRVSVKAYVDRYVAQLASMGKAPGQKKSTAKSDGGKRPVTAPAAKKKVAKKTGKSVTPQATKRPTSKRAKA